MSATRDQGDDGIARFRTRLLAAMMVLVSAAAVSMLILTQRNVATSVRRDFQRDFESQLASLQAVQEVRHAVIAERCRQLARKPRIHAALEDGALDLLYPSARDELVDATNSDEGAFREPGAYALRARYYRFLDGKGRVIAPPNAKDVGDLGAADESRLSTGQLPDRPQIGYIRRDLGGDGHMVDELIAMPIVSSESGEPIAAIVLGFKPPALGGSAASGVSGGIWLDGHLDFPTLADEARSDLETRLAPAIAESDGDHGHFEFSSGKDSFLVFFKRLNPLSPYPPAFEVSVLSLAESLAQQHRLAWEFASVGALVLGFAFLASHILSRRLSMPVERLAVDSKEHREHWHRAEAALESTSQELQRSARFSADASHQLKTPVTVLRAGLEELLAGENLRPEAREEVSALVHQTFRLASVVEDLLLLSRMDAGRLQIQLSSINLTPLFEALMDDVGAMPDLFDLDIDADVPPALWVKGEKGYVSLILQNLLENARKYNLTKGKIRIAAIEDEGWAVISIGNTGPAIPKASQEHIFERFHRGAVGENVPGHGIGLNLARELARLHGGDLRLSKSDDSWTEFELRLLLAPAPAPKKGAT
ncbi:MAG TPA: HAMP domain-containing sensor histidine kinase [Opitutaceae bacterium]|nr:HAMP domain-containing sensor histidine kinase [Opitutaceae bacterium]